MVQRLKLHRRVLISAIITVLVVASLGAAFAYQQALINKQATTTKLSVTLSTNQTSIFQGNSTKIPIEVSLTGNSENFTLTSAVNSSKVNCSFDRANGSSSFNSTLTVNVDDSAQGGNYSVTVKASSTSVSTNTSCLITVLVRNVTVSGKVNLSAGWTEITSLIFEDTRTNEKVTIQAKSRLTTFVPKNMGFYNITDHIFRVTLKNQDSYSVTATFTFGVMNIFSGSDVIGNLTVSTPARGNVMTGQEFTLTSRG
jgi:hypothetical protein